MRGVALVVCLAGCLLPGGVQAQDADSARAAGFATDPYRLTYDHVTARFTLHDDDGDVVRNWQDVPTNRMQSTPVPVPPNRPLELVVINANSLVYDYSFATAPVSTRRVRACGDIGKDFLSQGFFATTRSLMGAEAPIPSLSAVVQEVEAFRTANVRDIGLTTDRRARVFAQAKQAALVHQRFAEHVVALSGTLDDSLQMIALRAETEPINTLIDGLFATIDKAYPGFSDPRIPPVLLARSERNASDLLNETVKLGTSNDAMSLEAEALLANVKSASAAARQQMRDVQRALLRLARARAQSRQSTILLPSDIGRRVSITLAAGADSAAGFDVLPVREGEIVAYTRPAVGLVCNVSAGLNWMTPPAEYEITRDGVVADEVDEDEIRTAPAIFFSIGTAAFEQLALLGGIGLGEGGRPDFYLGASMRALEPVLLNAGAVWQRETQLPDGLNVGDTAPATISSFDREFKPTFFFGLSFGR